MRGRRTTEDRRPSTRKKASSHVPPSIQGAALLKLTCQRLLAPPFPQLGFRFDSLLSLIRCFLDPFFFPLSSIPRNSGPRLVYLKLLNGSSSSSSSSPSPSLGNDCCCALASVHT
ncbi:hypothetical protein CDEST_06203 [Colletotrichum destructivum]|uniref:Uncharacterized protein n=1 Tax=Colletotrichum destructivum TaxID=34406 RepID=A0AAX4IDY1_9PEZI|nr:hypothetical protein CDEST_06203 [Colletotrichum destructivum]